MFDPGAVHRGCVSGGNIMDALDVLVVLAYFGALLGYGWLSYCQGVVDGQHAPESDKVQRAIRFSQRLAGERRRQWSEREDGRDRMPRPHRRRG